MRNILPILLIAAAAAFGADLKGYKDILPGKDFKGWTRMPLPRTATLNSSSQWKVDPKSKILLCEGDKGHEWLRYDKELANYLLHVEWRYIKKEGEPRYNSGIFIRNSADGAIWHQAQAGLAGGWIFGFTPQGGENKRLDLRPQMKENRVKPAGEWNVYDIRVQGKTISLSVNGAVQSEFNECEFPKGYLGLEAEGFPIEFRNIKVKELK